MKAIKIAAPTALLVLMIVLAMSNANAANVTVTANFPDPFVVYAQQDLRGPRLEITKLNATTVQILVGGTYEDNNTQDPNDDWLHRFYQWPDEVRVKPTSLFLHRYNPSDTTQIAGTIGGFTADGSPAYMLSLGCELVTSSDLTASVFYDPNNPSDPRTGILFIGGSGAQSVTGTVFAVDKNNQYLVSAGTAGNCEFGKQYGYLGTVACGDTITASVAIDTSTQQTLMILKSSNGMSMHTQEWSTAGNFAKDDAIGNRLRSKMAVKMPAQLLPGVQFPVSVDRTERGTNVMVDVRGTFRADGRIYRDMFYWFRDEKLFTPAFAINKSECRTNLDPNAPVQGPQFVWVTNGDPDHQVGLPLVICNTQEGHLIGYIKPGPDNYGFINAMGVTMSWLAVKPGAYSGIKFVTNPVKEPDPAPGATPKTHVRKITSVTVTFNEIPEPEPTATPTQVVLPTVTPIPTWTPILSPTPTPKVQKVESLSNNGLGLLVLMALGLATRLGNRRKNR